MAIKAYSLEPHEQRLSEILDDEQKTISARMAVLMLDLEEARKQLATSQDRQRGMILAALFRNEAEGARSARIEKGNLICDLPDEPPARPLSPFPVNGEDKHDLRGIRHPDE